MGGITTLPALNPVDALPTPQQKDVQITPPPDGQAPSSQVPNRGWAGPGGQAAGMAADFLHGWMVGKYMKEQKLSRDAVNQVGNSKAALDVAVMHTSNLLHAGYPDAKPEDLPQLQERFNKETDPGQRDSIRKMMEVSSARRAVAGAYDAWKGTVSNYVQPAPPQGFKGRVKAAMMPQGPALISQAALTALNQQDPQSLVGQPTTTQQASAQEATATATIRKAQATSATEAQRAQQGLTDANSKLATAQASKDPNQVAAAQRDVETAKAQFEVAQGKPSTPVYGATAVGQQGVAVASQQLTNQKQTLDAQAAGMASLAKGGMPSQLSPDQQYAMNGGKLFDNVQDELWKGYQAQVKTPQNPDGKYNSLAEASKDYMIDQRRAMLYSRYAPVGVQIQQDTYDRLQTELQNPEAVKQYKEKYPNLAQAISQIRPGDPPPSALVSAESEARLRATPEEREAARQASKNLIQQIGPQGVNRLRGSIIDDALQMNPDWKDFTYASGSAAGGVSSNVKPWAQVQRDLHFWNSTDNAQKNYQAFQQATVQRARQEGLGDSEIDQVLPGFRPGSPVTAAPPPAPGATSIAPPPAPKSAAATSVTPPPGPAAGPRRYAVTGPDGSVQYRNWTPDQASKAKAAAGAGVTITEGGAPSTSAAPTTPAAAGAPAPTKKKLDDATAESILREAGMDPAKARALAASRGYEF